MNPIELRKEIEKREPAWFEEARPLYRDGARTKLADWLEDRYTMHNSVRTRVGQLSLWHLHEWEWKMLHGKARDAADLAIAARCIGDEFLMCVPVHRRLPNNIQYVPMDAMAFALAQTVSVGWQDRAELLARTAFEQLDGVLNHGITGHRAPYFLLELAKDWLGAHVNIDTDWRRNKIPDLGLWDKVLKNWRDPNPTSFIRLVGEIADFHVAQSHDLVEDGDEVEQFEVEPTQYWLFPVLIFTLLRLREWQGLSNPSVAHPLFEVSPLGQMPPVLAYPRDDLLDAVETKYRKMFPTFPTTADLPELRRKQGSVTLQ